MLSAYREWLRAVRTHPESEDDDEEGTGMEGCTLTRHFIGPRDPDNVLGPAAGVGCADTDAAGV